MGIFVKSQLFNFKNLKHANFFLSGSEHLINIWAPDDQLMPYCWQSKYKIEWTQSKINCVIIHPNKNLSISGDNENVKFCMFANRSQMNIKCLQLVFQKAQMEEKQSIRADKNLYVMADSEKEIWQILQQIQFNEYLLRICFITNQIFTFQIIQITFRNQKFIDIQSIAKNISLQGKGQHDLGDCQPIYVTSKQILMIKNGYFINIIRFILQNPRIRWGIQLLVRIINQFWL
ncbi:unnamed protein product [Paramecium pentaurelia]|uniref:Uncharacterized protein n=1 Tax=Paramecium pentaurelia TaxID=43138 RepID=A0A8S1SED9_9CILI|nr:unnamed protein product [Paramecium pentaurelia]